MIHIYIYLNKRHLKERHINIKIRNVFTVTFDQLNAPCLRKILLLNSSILCFIIIIMKIYVFYIICCKAFCPLIVTNSLSVLCSPVILLLSSFSAVVFAVQVDLHCFPLRMLFWMMVMGISL